MYFDGYLTVSGCYRGALSVIYLRARGRDFIADRTRAVTRLRETLLALFPALERVLTGSLLLMGI